MGKLRLTKVQKIALLKLKESNGVHEGMQAAPFIDKRTFQSLVEKGFAYSFPCYFITASGERFLETGKKQVLTWKKGEPIWRDAEEARRKG